MTKILLKVSYFFSKNIFKNISRLSGFTAIVKVLVRLLTTHGAKFLFRLILIIFVVVSIVERGVFQLSVITICSMCYSCFVETIFLTGFVTMTRKQCFSHNATPHLLSL